MSEEQRENSSSKTSMSEEKRERESYQASLSEEERERKRCKSSTSEEQRGLEDLWKRAFPVERMFGKPHLLSQYNWNFSSLQDAFKEGGVLHGEEKVFVFGHVQITMLGWEVIYVPTIVVIVSPFPPSDKIGIRSVDVEPEVTDMRNVNMGWVPYIPLGENERACFLERPLPQIFIIGYLNREVGSNIFELYPNLKDCFPCVHNELEKNTVVDIVYPPETGTIVCKYDWRFETPEEFALRLMCMRELCGDQKDAFMEFVREKVKQGKRANLEAIREQTEDLEELRRIEDRFAAFEKMRFYKFYPDATPDIPCVKKTAFINRYYRTAHQVF